VYQIFGTVETSKEELKNITSMYVDVLKEIPGLRSSSMYLEVYSGEIASVHFICENLEAVEKVKEMMSEAMERFKDIIGFTTEFTFKYVEHIENSLMQKRACTS
jgi:hypothetical protein